jgi:nucleotide-binding universal stress UspA family protein
MATSNVVALPKSSSIPPFDSLLVPVDGSVLSMAAAFKAVLLARRLAARLVAFHAIPVYQYPVYFGGIPFEYPSEADYETQCRDIAMRYLALVVKVAQEQGLTASPRLDFNSEPAHAIVAAAQAERCSLIFMGSHGRSGVSRFFLGSVALKTLTLAPVPVMVDRPTPEEMVRAEALMRQHAIEP